MVDHIVYSWVLFLGVFYLLRIQALFPALKALKHNVSRLLSLFRCIWFFPRKWRWFLRRLKEGNHMPKIKVKPVDQFSRKGCWTFFTSHGQWSEVDQCISCASTRFVREWTCHRWDHTLVQRAWMIKMWFKEFSGASAPVFHFSIWKKKKLGICQGM